MFFKAKEQQATIEEKFRNELNANIKLSNLYKVCLCVEVKLSSSDLCGNIHSCSNKKNPSTVKTPYYVLFVLSYFIKYIYLHWLIYYGFYQQHRKVSCRCSSLIFLWVEGHVAAVLCFYHECCCVCREQQQIQRQKAKSWVEQWKSYKSC